MKADCVYDKVTEKVYCSQCFETEGLVMRALRKEDKLVGHVWMCPQCAGQISALEAEFTPVFKAVMHSVVAA